jgi:hypothetical protein
MAGRRIDQGVSACVRRGDRGDRVVAKAIVRRAPAGREKRSCGPRQRDARVWANAEASSDRRPARSGRMLSGKALAVSDPSLPAGRIATSSSSRRRRRGRLLSRGRDRGGGSVGANERWPRAWGRARRGPVPVRTSPARCPFAVPDGQPAAARQAKVLARVEVLVRVQAVSQVAHARTPHRSLTGTVSSSAGSLRAGCGGRPG